MTGAECIAAAKPSRRPLQKRSSMDPAHGMKVATMEAGSDDLWNLDLSDLIQHGPGKQHRPGTTTMHRRLSASCNDLGVLEDSAAVESSPVFTRSSSCRDIKKHLSVSFHMVETREFERVLDINPSCQGGGPSLGLGWNYNIKKSVDLSKKSKSRPSLSPFRHIVGSKSANKKKATTTVTALSAAERMKLAKQSGFSKEEIQRNVAEVYKAQKQREKSNKDLSTNAQFQEVVHNMRDLVRPKRSSRVGSASA